MKTIALYLIPPGCRALSGATCTTFSLAINRAFFVLPAEACACALERDVPYIRGLKIIPATRTPTTRPAITAVFIVAIVI
ncbi:MAG TPA: hypothetical protein VE223_03615 [Nitrososphaeraceae archaeon]|nr:hypothetical protein [Nitrososphaeraceae archaeon]